MVDTTIIAGCCCVAILAGFTLFFLFFTYLFFTKSNKVTSENPLDDFDAWLEQVGAPKMWINTTVMCVALLAEELTGFRPQDYGIDQFPSAPGRNWSTAVYDYYRDSKQGWLDDRYTGVKGSKTGVSACPGVGDSTAKALANVGIYTTRDLINKFNSFSGLSIKPKYI